jgi:hypothetical protein
MTNEFGLTEEVDNLGEGQRYLISSDEKGDYIVERNNGKLLFYRENLKGKWSKNSEELPVIKPEIINQKEEEPKFKSQVVKNETYK